MTNKRFEYVKYDAYADTVAREIKNRVYGVELLIQSMHPSRETALALTKLEECFMWVGKAIKVDQEKREASES